MANDMQRRFFLAHLRTAGKTEFSALSDSDLMDAFMILPLPAIDFNGWTDRVNALSGVAEAPQITPEMQNETVIAALKANKPDFVTIEETPISEG
jgi:hypothetical protein